MATLAASLKDRSLEITQQLLEAITEDYPGRDFAIRFWDGSTWGNVEDPRFTFVLKHPSAVRRMLSGANQLTMGEAYIYDDFDLEGDMEAAFEFAEYLISHELEISKKLQLAALLLKLPGRPRSLALVDPKLEGALHSRQRDREAVTYHYNLSNDFYSLWLDRRMVYSCAYFQSGDEDIDSAQEQKLDYICRKLRLQPGERLLDVGCGWGGLILYAAQKFGVQALGVTLSEPQAKLARARIQEAGLSDRCEVRVCDYRDLEDMLGNLIDNAAKWTKSIISITVKTVQSEGIVEILIEDDGPGLPLESRARVFEIGERLDEQAPGSGLGLAIVKDFADLYGGRVWIGDSEFGGAAVYLILPVAS